MVYIYILVDPITYQTRYIGKTKNCYQRFQHHLVSTANVKSHKRNWINSLIDQGFKPLFYIIDEVEEENWKFWERYWICQFKTWGFNLVNHTDGGDGLSNGNQTSFKKGVVPWNKRFYNYGTSKKGSKIPQEVKDKISKGLQGNNCKPKRQVKQYTKEGELVATYISTVEAAKLTGFPQACIASALNSKSHISKGFIWK